MNSLVAPPLSVVRNLNYRHRIISLMSVGLVLISFMLIAIVSAQAAPIIAAASTERNAEQSPGQIDTIDNTLASQLKPSNEALSAANQKLLSQNAQLQRQVNDLQTQANVLVYESKGQLFLYGAFTVLISLLVGIFVSWLVFVRRERW